MALRYGATVSDSTELSDLLGIIAIATPYSMPDTIRRRWDRYASEPSYEEVYRKASRLFGKSADANKAHDEIVVVRRAHGPTARPEHSDIYTLRTWWALAGPEAEGAKPYKQVGKITVPLLLVHGSADELISSRELEDLSRLASARGNPDVTHVQLDANHTFDGKHAELGDCIVGWLADRFE